MANYGNELGIKARRDRILELNEEAKADPRKALSIRETADRLGTSIKTIVNDYKYLRANHFDLINSHTNRWINIISRTKSELEWYKANNMYPCMVRQPYYRLIELAKTDPTIEQTKSINNYKQYCKKTAEARRGCNSSYTKITKLPSLPFDCFYDDSRTASNDTDIDRVPINPTPAEAPEDPIEVTLNAIKQCRDDILNYDGSCYEGEKGVNCGKWYMQPTYCEIWTEHRNLQKNFVQNFQGDLHVPVIANRGFGSMPYVRANCQNLKNIVLNHPHIEKVVILYFGDFDSSGDFLDENIFRAMKWYIAGELSEEGIIEERSFEWHGIEFELKRIAVTPEQIEEYDLVEDPEFEEEQENEDSRYNRFKEKYPKLVEKYGEKFGIQLEAMITTDERLKLFKKIVQDAILKCWNEDIWLENCPPELPF